MRAAIGRWRERRRLEREVQAAVVDVLVERERYGKAAGRSISGFDRYDLGRSMADAEKRLHAVVQEQREVKAEHQTFTVRHRIRETIARGKDARSLNVQIDAAEARLTRTRGRVPDSEADRVEIADEIASAMKVRDDLIERRRRLVKAAR